MTRVLIALFLFGTVCLVSADSRAKEKPAEAPKIEVKLKKPVDAISFRAEKTRTLVVITSESGIGGATLSLADGKWPKNVVLRFQYSKDRGFDKVESLAVTTDRLHFSGSASEAKMPFYLADVDGKFPAKDGVPAGTLELKVAKKDGALEVALPANWLVGSKDVKLAWIDAFRR